MNQFSATSPPDIKDPNAPWYHLNANGAGALPAQPSHTPSYTPFSALCAHCILLMSTNRGELNEELLFQKEQERRRRPLLRRNSRASCRPRAHPQGPLGLCRLPRLPRTSRLGPLFCHSLPLLQALINLLTPPELALQDQQGSPKALFPRPYQASPA